MTTLTRILTAAVLGLALIAGLQTMRVYRLQASAAKAEAAHATALATALRRQSDDLSQQTAAERRAREIRERQVAGLTAKLKQMEDYHARLAPVLHLRIDRMLDHARQPGGLVPPDSGAPPRARTAAGRGPAAGG